jgi:hypothetical protein
MTSMAAVGLKAGHITEGKPAKIVARAPAFLRDHQQKPLPKAASEGGSFFAVYLS